MKKKPTLLLLVVLFACTCAYSQNQSFGYVPVFGKKLNLENGIIYQNTGSQVGIGTAFPNARLDVVSIGKDVARFTNSENSSTLLFTGAEKDFTVSTKQGFDMRFETYSESGDHNPGQLVLHNNGNVAIGGSLIARLDQSFQTLDSDDTIAKFPESSERSRILLYFNGSSGAGILNGVKNKSLLLTTINSNGAVNSNQLYLSPDGNVGIGLSNPTACLEVSSGSSILAKFTHLGSGSIEITGTSIRNATDNKSLTLTTRNNNGGTNRYQLHLSPNGNVGIGVNEPTARLEVSSGSSILAKFTHLGSGSIEISGTSIRNATDNKSLTLTTRNNSSGTNQYQLHLSPNGNVGIGIDSPTGKLQVNNGTFKISGTRNSDGETARFVIDMGNSTNGNFIELKSQGVKFKVNGNGIVYANEVNLVANIPTPDYVFEKDYNLMALEDLEEFISQNKHLPNVPSAKEVEEAGLNIAALSNILLEKVEELTLYTIQQQKLIDELTEIVKEQQKKNKRSRK
jgi:hypothetical protein